MNKRQAYLDLQEEQRKEIEEFPIAYAFSKEQLEEDLKKLDAKREECVTIFNHGDIVKKENAPKFIDMLKRHTKEVQDELIKGEEFAEAAFLYEMDNHEYAINWDGDADVLGCFSLSEKDIVNKGLDRAYRRARNKHMKHAREWDMI